MRTKASGYRDANDRVRVVHEGPSFHAAPQVSDSSENPTTKVLRQEN